MTRRFIDLQVKTIKGATCPNCKASNSMISSGHAMGRDWKMFRRFHCTKCKIYTIHPLGINQKQVKR
jgi:transposase-like protein